MADRTWRITRIGFWEIAIYALSVVCVQVPTDATQYQPWLGNIYEFEFQSDLSYENYSKISKGNTLKKKYASDFFLQVSVSSAIPDVGIELEIVQAKTRRQRGEIDNFKLTGRYVWLDDIAGDDLSVLTGISYDQAFKKSLTDLSSFHHGLYETEFFLSIGKEKSEGENFDSRWWSLFGLGLAERGSSWFRFEGTYEKMRSNNHLVRLFLHSLWGFGNKRLNEHHFNGYGSIKHQSVDLGFRYTYFFNDFGNMSIEYSYRVYAFNFPAYTHHALAQFLYPFGL